MTAARQSGLESPGLSRYIIVPPFRIEQLGRTTVQLEDGRFPLRLNLKAASSCSETLVLARDGDQVICRASSGESKIERVIVGRRGGFLLYLRNGSATTFDPTGAFAGLHVDRPVITALNKEQQRVVFRFSHNGHGQPGIAEAATEVGGRTLMIDYEHGAGSRLELAAIASR